MVNVKFFLVKLQITHWTQKIITNEKNWRLKAIQCWAVLLLCVMCELNERKVPQNEENILHTLFTFFSLFLSFLLIFILCLCAALNRNPTFGSVGVFGTFIIISLLNTRIRFKWISMRIIYNLHRMNMNKKKTNIVNCEYWISWIYWNVSLSLALAVGFEECTLMSVLQYGCKS